MRLIAHISDLHFGRLDPLVVEGLLTDLSAARPWLIVISGDLVQRAKRRHFRAARIFLDRLPAPYLIVPGNHDIPTYNVLLRLLDPFGNYRRFITTDLSPRLIEADIAVLGLTTPRQFILNFAHGRINHAQVEQVHEVFAPLPNSVFKVLVTHHPFLPPPDEPTKSLTGRAETVMPHLAASGVDLMLAGHYHLGYSGDIRSHHHQVERSVLVVQASTATSTRLREPANSYNLIRIDPPQVSVTIRSWTGDAFATTTTEIYTRTAKGWMRPDKA
ncbi:3',5'-cyclic AMP phosphodiesterase CpdA [uncultured Gammaproteobacteria bacterium]